MVIPQRRRLVRTLRSLFHRIEGRRNAILNSLMRRGDVDHLETERRTKNGPTDPRLDSRFRPVRDARGAVIVVSRRSLATSPSESRRRRPCARLGRGTRDSASPSARPSSRRPTRSWRRFRTRCRTTCARRCARSTASRGSCWRLCRGAAGRAQELPAARADQHPADGPAGRRSARLLAPRPPAARSSRRIDVEIWSSSCLDGATSRAERPAGRDRHRRAAAVPGRPGAAQAGLDQPAVQRPQVHGQRAAAR